MSNEPKRNLVSMREAARRIGCARGKAFELIKEGKIIAYRMGQKNMVDADSIDAFHRSLPRVPCQQQRETA